MRLELLEGLHRHPPSVGKQASRLRSAGFLLLVVAFVRLAELVPVIIVLAQPPGGGSVYQGLWLHAIAVLVFHLVVLAIALVFGIGLFREHEWTYRVFVANLRLPIALLVSLSFFSFVVGVFLSPLLLIVVLALVLHPETRREVDEAGYARPSFDAKMKVLRQRDVRERVPVDDTPLPFPGPRSRSRLCPECDGLNAEDAATCRHCGFALTQA